MCSRKFQSKWIVGKTFEFIKYFAKFAILQWCMNAPCFTFWTRNKEFQPFFIRI